MHGRVEITSIDEIPRESRVCHVDELDWPAKSLLATVDADTSTDVSEDVLDAFGSCDVVKYTDYLEVSIE